jgi:hypothetical protein
MDNDNIVLAPQDGGKKKKASKAKRAAPKKAAPKKTGGSVMAELQTLAVPFGLLLAKKGLDNALQKNATATKSAQASSPKPVSVKRGGSKAKKSLSMEFTQLSNEIQKFLDKYN